MLYNAENPPIFRAFKLKIRPESLAERKKTVLLRRNFAVKQNHSFKTYDESVRDRFHYDSRFV